MESVLVGLKGAYPELTFAEAAAFSWSPKNQTVNYSLTKQHAEWALLHEVGHAILGHKNYETDFELLLMEVAAWEKAKELSARFGVTIDEDHIQDCIDTYRDWLYQRSNCPTCSNTSLQADAVTYCCFNCGGTWTVTASRFCRPYRLSSKQSKSPLKASESPTTTFL